MQWILTGLLALIGLAGTVGNYFCVYMGIVRRKHISMIPLVGGIAGSLAMFVCPVHALRLWSWLPLILDLGCAYMLACLVYAVVVLKAFR